MFIFFVVLLIIAITACLLGYIDLGELLAIGLFILVGFSPIWLELATSLAAPTWFTAALAPLAELGWAWTLSLGAGLAFLVSPETVVAFVSGLGDLAADVGTAIGETVGSTLSALTSSSGLLPLLALGLGAFFLFSQRDSGGDHAAI
jgi:hypothetical protein